MTEQGFVRRSKWFVPEELSDEAQALAASGRRLIAPRLIGTEVASALCKLVRQRSMHPRQAEARMAALHRYFDRILDEDDLLLAALLDAASLDHPIYDFVYLEAARRHDAITVSADQHFRRKIERAEDARLVRHPRYWDDGDA